MGEPSVEGSAGPGEADYRGRNLRGVSFRGQDLDGADFREADLRGADFTGASLRGADFTGAKLGVRRHIGLIILLAAAAVAASAAAGSAIVAGEVRDRANSPDWDVLASGAGTGLVLLAFLALLYWRGPRTALLFFPIIVVLGLVAGVIVKSAFADYDAGFAVVTVAILLLFVLVVLAGILVRVLASTFGLIFIVGLTLTAGLASGTLHGGIAAILLSVFMTVVARRAAGRSKRERPIEQIAHRIITLRGTRFTGADLTGANFTGTEIVHTDMSDALVDHAVWDNGKGPSPLVLSTRRSLGRTNGEQPSDRAAESI
jgi:hypothetical protein